MEASPIRIDEANAADAAAIRAVVEAAFGQPTEADLVEALAANGHAVLSLVARADDTVVGHLLFSRLAVTPQPETGGAPPRGSVLAPLSVRPDLQRRGIGTRLVREGLARLEAAGEDLVMVLGDPDFYARFGFRPGRSDRIRTPWPVPENQWLALADKPLPLRLDIGYPPPFAALA